jgi:hypothetical protein
MKVSHLIAIPSVEVPMNMEKVEIQEMIKLELKRVSEAIVS